MKHKRGIGREIIMWVRCRAGQHPLSPILSPFPSPHSPIAPTGLRMLILRSENAMVTKRDNKAFLNAKELQEIETVKVKKLET